MESNQFFLYVDAYAEFSGGANHYADKSFVHLIESKEYAFLNQLLQDKQFVVAEKYFTVLLEYVYRKQFDIVKQVIKNICGQPSVVSFVVIRRVVDGAINAGQFESAVRVNEIQQDIDTYKVFFYSGLGNILLYRSKDID